MKYERKSRRKRTVTDTRLSVKGESEDDDVERVEEFLKEQS